ncbi:MAG: DUF1667 domain-containing protein [Clostridiales bacterium]|nr:DUF1667 domain-containing protein [Clostridiales bacterium]
MEQMITCISCPVGCRMTVTLSESGEFLSVTGNTCPRGARYAKQECTAPERMITAVIPAKGSDTPLSVKTRTPVPKALIFPIMEKLRETEVSAPAAIGDVICPDVLGTGVDIIATRNLP